MTVSYYVAGYYLLLKYLTVYNSQRNELLKLTVCTRCWAVFT